MRAVAAFPSKRTLELIDAPQAAGPGAGEAKVRTLEVGICGTDKEIASFEYGTPPDGSEYLILGHECLGEVVEVGAGVTGLRPGDLVVPRVRRPCPHVRCDPCRRGRSDFCITGDYTERGIVKRHGFACESWVESTEYLHRVPKELRGIAVLTEPLTIAEKAMRIADTAQRRLPDWPPSHGEPHALVIGSGPVGLLGALALIEAGFKTHVYARTPTPNPKAEAAERLGARYLSSAEVKAAELAARLGDIHFVYEAAGASSTAFEVLEVLGPNGVFIFTGVPGRKQPLVVDGARLMKRLVLSNQAVLGTVNAGPDAFAAAIEDLGRFESRRPGALGSLRTHQHTPDEAPRVLREGARGGIKHVIRFDGG